MKWSFSEDSSLIFTYDLGDKTSIEQTRDGKFVSSISGDVLGSGANNKYLIDANLSFWETYRGKLFSKTIVPPDFRAIGVRLTDGQLTAFSNDGRIITRPLDEFGPLDEVLAVAERRTRSLLTRIIY